MRMEVVSSSTLRWNVSVDAPICYTSKFATGEHGVLIEGFQYIPNGSVVSYEIVKRGFWRDKIFDNIEINHNGKFSVKLEDLPKKEYQIRICGYGMAHGSLRISPY
jgi:hypothetical protein